MKCMAQEGVYRSGRRRMVFLSGAALIGIWFAVYITYLAPVDVLMKLGRLGERTAAFRIRIASDDQVAERINDCFFGMKVCGYAIADNINRVSADDLTEHLNMSHISVKLSSVWPYSETAIREMLTKGGDHEAFAHTSLQLVSPDQRLSDLVNDKQLSQKVSDRSRWLELAHRIGVYEAEQQMQAASGPL